MPSIHPLRVEAHPTLGRRRAEWDAIVEAMPVPSPFLRSWWLDSVNDRHTTFLLVVDEDGTLVGGLPVHVRRMLGVSLVRIAGSGPLTPDHLDLVALAGRADDVGAVLDQWRVDLGNVLLDLDGLVENSTLSDRWGPASPIDVAPYRTLTSREDYLTGLSKSQRYSLRRAEKKLFSSGMRHRAVTTEGVPATLEAFRTMQQSRPGREHLVSSLDRLYPRLVAGQALGEVRVDELASDEETIAVMISFVVADRLSLYQVARSTEREHDGAGNVLMHAVFQHASTTGWREIDMLRGAEAYKYKFVDQARQLWRIRRAYGGRARVLLVAWQLASRARGHRVATSQRFADVSGRTRRLTAP